VAFIVYTIIIADNAALPVVYLLQVIIGYARITIIDGKTLGDVFPRGRVTAKNEQRGVDQLLGAAEAPRAVLARV